MGVAVDVFGNGKTSLKANVSKYLQPANNESTFIQGNPGVTFQATTNRTWTDANGNFTPDCGPAGLNSNTTFDGRASGGDFCGSFGAGTGNFGNANASTLVNPAALHGWGVRPYDWQYGVSVQQQLVPRVSVDVAFNRRSWGNFFVTDNRAVQASDYSPITITAPLNANLPGGGGYPVTFMARNAEQRAGHHRQLLHLRQRLRRREVLLAGDRRQPQRPSAKRPVTSRAARSLGLRRAGQLRGDGQGAGDSRRGVPIRHPAGEFLQLHRAVADDVPGPRVVHDSEDRRADQQLVPVASQRAARCRRHARGDQRRVARRPTTTFSAIGLDRRAVPGREPGATRDRCTATGSTPWICDSGRS